MNRTWMKLGSVLLLSGVLAAVGCETRVRTESSPGTTTLPAKDGAEVKVDVGGGRGINVDVDRDRPLRDKDVDVDVDIGGPRGGVKVDVDE